MDVYIHTYICTHSNIHTYIHIYSTHYTVTPTFSRDSSAISIMAIAGMPS